MTFKLKMTALTILMCLTFGHLNASCAQGGGVGGGGGLPSAEIPSDDFRYDCDVELAEQYNDFRTANLNFSVTRAEVLEAVGNQVEITTTPEMWHVAKGSKMPAHLANHSIYFDFGVSRTRFAGKARVTANIKSGDFIAQIQGDGSYSSKEDVCAFGQLMDSSKSFADNNGLHNSLSLSMEITCRRSK